MTEHIRIGDITGFDDAEVIDMGDDVMLVQESEVQTNENEQQNV